MTTQGCRLMPVVRIAFMALLAAWCWSARGAIPDQINYQGILTTSAGAPVAGPVAMTFTLYDAGANVLYFETQLAVPLSNGVFNVAIGGNPAFSALPFDVPYFLGVKVGSDPEMSPRQAVLASPYALNSANAQALASTATVGGAQITGTISVATVPTAQLSGTIGTAQIANSAVTQTKLSPFGAAPGNVLGTDGTNLQWQPANAGAPSPATTVVSETAFGQAPAVGASANYAREDHTHGTPTLTLPALGGDAAGPISNTTVVGLQGRAVATTAPVNGQVLTFNAGTNRWEPGTPTVVPPAPVFTGFAGPGGSFAANSGAFVFAPPTGTINVLAGGRLTGSASVPLATVSGTANFDFGLCYQLGAGAITLFAGGGNYQSVTATTSVSMFSTAATTTVITAGTYKVGLCIHNASAVGIGSDWVNGWVMATTS